MQVRRLFIAAAFCFLAVVVHAPAQTAPESKEESSKRIENEMSEGIQSLAFLLAISNPAEEIPPHVRKDLALDIRPVPAQNRNVRSTAEFDRAPQWIKSMILTIQVLAVQPNLVPLDLTKHDYQGKTVYHLAYWDSMESDVLGTLYDEKGKVICGGMSQTGGKGPATCADFSRAKATPVWQRRPVAVKTSR